MNYRMNLIQWVEYFLLKTVRKDTLSLKDASVSACERDSISTGLLYKQTTNDGAFDWLVGWFSEIFKSPLLQVANLLDVT